MEEFLVSVGSLVPWLAWQIGVDQGSNFGAFPAYHGCVFRDVSQSLVTWVKKLQCWPKIPGHSYLCLFKKLQLWFVLTHIGLGMVDIQDQLHPKPSVLLSRMLVSLIQHP